jgi:hypothetical protein
MGRTKAVPRASQHRLSARCGRRRIQRQS